MAHCFFIWVVKISVEFCFVTLPIWIGGVHDGRAHENEEKLCHHCKTGSLTPWVQDWLAVRPEKNGNAVKKKSQKVM